mmetsp:Transcript_12057/g.17936  ORF Transcript_12057/g.17936 Transcript_12057/m.17936 type:complete len:302 (-) Transcript_12057:2013-2918(-)
MKEEVKLYRNRLDKQVIKVIDEQLRLNQGEIPSYGPIRGIIYRLTRKSNSITTCQQYTIRLLRKRLMKKDRQYINAKVEEYYPFVTEKEIVDKINQDDKLFHLPKIIIKTYITSTITRIKKRYQNNEVNLLNKSTEDIYSKEKVNQIVRKILQTSFTHIESQMKFKEFITHYGGYIGKTTCNNIKDEAYKRLTSRYKSRKTGNYTAPLLTIKGERLTEQQLIKDYNCKCKTLYECKNLHNIGLIERELQKTLQYLPPGKRLWTQPSCAGRNPSSYKTCKVYYTYSKELPNHITESKLQLNM